MHPSQIQGCAKINFPGCVKLGETIVLCLPTEHNFFHTTWEVGTFLVQPCMYVSMLTWHSLLGWELGLLALHHLLLMVVVVRLLLRWRR